MAPSVKLAVISKMDWETSLLGNRLVFLHFLYILVRRKTAIRISCLLARRNFLKTVYSSLASNSNVFYDSYEVLRDCYIG